MCSDVGREMVGAREVSHTDPALERFLTGVSSHVSRQLITPTEPPDTVSV